MAAWGHHSRPFAALAAAAFLAACQITPASAPPPVPEPVMSAESAVLAAGSPTRAAFDSAMPAIFPRGELKVVTAAKVRYPDASIVCDDGTSNADTINPTVVFEVLVEWLHAHFANATLNQFANTVVHHRRNDTGFESKAIAKIRCNVVLATRHVNIKRFRFAKRNDAWI